MIRLRRGKGEGGGEKKDKTMNVSRVNLSNLPALTCVTDCVLQTSQHSEQVCVHETGCQSPQEESKPIY